MINNQQTGNLVFDGDWTVASGGVITGGRIMLIPVDSNQASNTYIDFKSGNWQRIRNLNGTIPDIIDTLQIQVIQLQFQLWDVLSEDIREVVIVHQFNCSILLLE